MSAEFLLSLAQALGALLAVLGLVWLLARGARQVGIDAPANPQALLGLDVDTMNALSAGIVVGIMIIPTISSLSEDVLRSVPRGLREAAYALGSTRFDVSVRVVVPAALSGILASFLLAMARAVGETMAVVIAGGQNPRLTANPFKQIESMTAYIVNISLGEAAAGSIEELSLYAVAMTLFLITLSTNIAAQFILRRFREVYQ
jgi:phosphate transport system permease protein